MTLALNIFNYIIGDHFCGPKSGHVLQVRAGYKEFIVKESRVETDNEWLRLAEVGNRFIALCGWESRQK